MILGEFSSKVVAVTGGASGIGRGIVEAFASEGAKVFFADVNEDRGLNTCHDIRMTCIPESEVAYKRADLSKSEEAMDFINHVLSAISILKDSGGIKPGTFFNGGTVKVVELKFK